MSNILEYRTTPAPIVLTGARPGVDWKGSKDFEFTIGSSSSPAIAHDFFSPWFYFIFNRYIIIIKQKWKIYSTSRTALFFTAW